MTRRAGRTKQRAVQLEASQLGSHSIPRSLNSLIVSCHEGNQRSYIKYDSAAVLYQWCCRSSQCGLSTRAYYVYLHEIRATQGLLAASTSCLLLSVLGPFLCSFLFMMECRLSCHFSRDTRLILISFVLARLWENGRFIWTLAERPVSESFRSSLNPCVNIRQAKKPQHANRQLRKALSSCHTSRLWYNNIWMIVHG